MASLNQIEANRRNSQHSTGPRTESGKSITRLNALKSGVDAELDVIPGEDPNTLTQLTAEYFDRFHPTTPEARCLVDALITNDWLLRRLRLVEAALWTHDINDTFKRSDSPLALAADNQDRTFERLQRRMNAVQRNYHRALTDLRSLQQDPVPHPAERPAPELTLVPTTIPALAPTPIGFVPPSPPTPSTPAARNPPPIPATFPPAGLNPFSLIL